MHSSRTRRNERTHPAHAPSPPHKCDGRHHPRCCRRRWWRRPPRPRRGRGRQDVHRSGGACLREPRETTDSIQRALASLRLTHPHPHIRTRPFLAGHRAYRLRPLSHHAARPVRRWLVRGDHRARHHELRGAANPGALRATMRPTERKLPCCATDPPFPHTLAPPPSSCRRPSTSHRLSTASSALPLLLAWPSARSVGEWVSARQLGPTERMGGGTRACMR